eukprot:UN10132
MTFFMFFILFQLLFSISLSYFTGPNPLTWSEGQAYCKSLHTTLASIHSDADFRSARSLCVAVNDVAIVSDAYGCWIGLMFSKEGTLANIDGTTSDYGFIHDNTQTPTPNTGIKPWPPAHPESNRSKRDCVQLSATKNYYYGEDVCNVTKYPLCNDKPVISSNIIQYATTSGYDCLYYKSCGLARSIEMGHDHNVSNPTNATNMFLRASTIENIGNNLNAVMGCISCVFIMMLLTAILYV